MKEEGPVNWEAIHAGSIPWDEDEICAAMDHLHHLSVTPHDDWDRRPEEAIFVDEQGRPTGTIRMNPDRIENQVMGFIRDRSIAAGHDRTTIMSHMWRFMEVLGFLSEHSEKLIGDGLIRMGDSEVDEMSVHLIRELASAPYQGIRLHPSTREEERTFDYEAVVLRAKARGA